MLTISEDALAVITEKQSPIFIDVPHTVTGCCFEVTDCPSIRFGTPRDFSNYSKREIQACIVYVPNSFPDAGDFVIRTKSLLGFKRLSLTGWRLI